MTALPPTSDSRSPETIIGRLMALPLFSDVPRAELEWLATEGEITTFEAGAMARETLTPVEEMAIVLEGRVGLYVERGGGSRKLMEAPTGHVIGVLPYSRFKRTPGTAVFEEATTLFTLHQRHFPILMREHIGLTAALVHHMLDRAREYRSAELNDDRLQSLSRLASGFAHELNNPASAASRTARSLVTLLDEEQTAAAALAAGRLTDDQLSLVAAVRRGCVSAGQTRTALEAADREDDISDWLARHGVAHVAVDALAASDVTLPLLDQLAAAVPNPALTTVLRWISAALAACTASREIEVATTRMHDLIAAVKGFTFMDREGVPEEVDIARGLSDTLAVLDAKARARSVVLNLETAPDLPRVRGFGSEINQVWEKVINNALDAVETAGHVTITASTRGDSVIVRIRDDGAGIPDTVRSRIFDPFFTTKAVGRGTGLGLYQARRIVHLHGGDIECTSEPGRTVFRVRLPVAGASSVVRAL